MAPTFLRSLRWRLQAWHAGILFLAVAGFGATLYYEVRQSHFDEIDGELLAAARTLEGTLRAVPRPVLEEGFRGPPNGGPPNGGPPIERRGFRPEDGRPTNELDNRFGDPQANEETRDGEREGRRQPPRNEPPREDRPFQKGGPGRGEGMRRPLEGGLEGRPDGPNGPPGERQGQVGDRQGPPGDRQGRQGPPPMRGIPPEQLQRMLTLPQSFVDRFTEQGSPPYFMVWAANNAVLKSQALPIDLPPPVAIPPRPGMGYRARQLGSYREVILEGPERSRILVGRSIEYESARMRTLLWQLVFTGVGVFATGLVGGWWLSGRAVKPIEAMSDTAASISASNLSRRIDTVNVDYELAALGQVLNATFDRLQAAFEQQARFTADASHELRTPLAVVLTNSELALSRDRDAEDYRETIETCLRAARRMKRLVDDLMVLARADAGKLELRVTTVDLRELIDECVSLVEPLGEQRQIDIAAHGPHTIVPGDADRLAQVITNLLSNAIQYNVDGGNVTVGIKEDAGMAEISVADTGVGIDPADLPHLFERFYRVDKARSRFTGGSGLGLAICKTIIEAHGGQIEVAGNLHGGTMVKLKLPVGRNFRPSTGDPRSARVDPAPLPALGTADKKN